ncbi:hypothetical protein HYW55_04640 [Candidatus Gottesmanbacteria bacterium]|nr:hypothetical protein [Candidatus Gottesmanbacteria bacterium]
MNTSLEQIHQVQATIDQAEEIVIAISKNPSFDAMAAALSIYLTLSSQGKRVSVVCPNPPTVEFSHLVGTDKLGNAINGASGRNLIISFPYQEGSIEKVSYNIENNAFNLVIEPRENFPRITPEMMNYSYSGGKTDLIITVGVAQLTNLDTLYSRNESLFTEKPIVNIDISSQNQQYGKINIVDSTTTTLSELVTTLLTQMDLPIDQDTATNLLAGITAGSNSFSLDSAQASTFETVAFLLRKGAKRIIVTTQESTSTSIPFTRPPVKPQGGIKPIQSQFTKQQFQQRNLPPRPKQYPQTQQQPQQPKNEQQGISSKPQNNETPPDWLKPKIYKSSTLL